MPPNFRGVGRGLPGTWLRGLEQGVAPGDVAAAGRISFPLRIIRTAVDQGSSFRFS